MATYDSILDRTTNADTRSVGPIDLPDDVASEVIKALPEQSAILGLARRVTMTRRTMRMPVLSALPVAYWVGGDTGLKQTSAVAWKNKYLVAAELAAIIPVPQAVLDDEAFPIWDEVRPSLVEAAGALIDGACLFGAGWPTEWGTQADIMTGIEAAENEVVRGALSASQDLSVDIDGPGGVMNLVEADGFTPNGFAADATFKASLRGLRDSNGQPVFLRGLTGAVYTDGTATTDTLEGLPIKYINNGAFDLSKADLIAGDWRMAIVGVRQDITITTHTEGVISDDAGAVVLNLLQQDSAALRMVMRVGFAVANPVTRRGASGAGAYPFAALLPAGTSGT